MNQEYFKVLKHLARSSFEDAYRGFDVVLDSDENFRKYMERPYRLKVYERELDFYMTANERNFHLVGFLDAIICLERMGLITWNPENWPKVVGEDDEELDEEDRAELLEYEKRFQMECDALKHLVVYVETGEE